MSLDVLMPPHPKHRTLGLRD